MPTATSIEVPTTARKIDSLISSPWRQSRRAATRGPTPAMRKAPKKRHALLPATPPIAPGPGRGRKGFGSRKFGGPPRTIRLFGWNTPGKARPTVFAKDVERKGADTTDVERKGADTALEALTETHRAEVHEVNQPVRIDSPIPAVAYAAVALMALLMRMAMSPSIRTSAAARP